MNNVEKKLISNVKASIWMVISFSAAAIALLELRR